MKKIDLEEATRRLFEFRPDEAYTIDEVLWHYRRWHVVAFRCRRGEVCIKAGAPATEFAVVVSGILHVKMPSDIGDDILMRVVKQGEYVGLSLLFTQESKYQFDVIAATNADVVMFNVAEVRKWRTDPASQPLYNYIGLLMGNVIREAMMRSMILSGRDIAERLRRYLTVRMDAERSRSVAIRGTSADLANYLGVNKCALSRAIGRMRAEGKIKFERNVFTVL